MILTAIIVLQTLTIVGLCFIIREDRKVIAFLNGELDRLVDLCTEWGPQ